MPLLCGRRVSGHLEDEFQFNGGAEGKAGDTVNQAAGVFVFSEDVLEQVGCAVGDFRLFADIAQSGH